jgi:hypothetical protein
MNGLNFVVVSTQVHLIARTIPWLYFSTKGGMLSTEGEHSQLKGMFSAEGERSQLKGMFSTEGGRSQLMLLLLRRRLKNIQLIF